MPKRVRHSSEPNSGSVKRLVKFNPSWVQDYPWVKGSGISVNHAFCKLCSGRLANETIHSLMSCKFNISGTCYEYKPPQNVLANAKKACNMWNMWNKEVKIIFLFYLTPAKCVSKCPRKCPRNVLYLSQKFVICPRKNSWKSQNGPRKIWNVCYLPQ